MVQFLLLSAVLLVFGSIVVTDFRYRLVYAWQVLLFYVACMLLGYCIGPQITGWDIVFNLGYLGLQVAIGYVWLVSQQGNRHEKIIDRKIGLGDLLLVPALALGFGTLEFVLTYTLSLIFALAMALLLRSSVLRKKPSATIPLAGCVALFYCIWLPMRFYLPLHKGLFLF